MRFVCWLLLPEISVGLPAIDLPSLARSPLGATNNPVQAYGAPILNKEMRLVGIFCENRIRPSAAAAAAENGESDEGVRNAFCTAERAVIHPTFQTPACRRVFFRTDLAVPTRLRNEALFDIRDIVIWLFRYKHRTRHSSDTSVSAARFQAA